MSDIELNTKLSPQHVFKNKANLTVESINAENHEIFWFDHFEYPPEGGILAYKYGGIAVQQEGEPHKFFCRADELNELASKEKDLGYVPKSNRVPLCGNCDMVEVTFVPKTEIQNRVDLLYPEKGFIEPSILEMINDVKAILIGQIQFFASKEAFMAMGFSIFLPFKMKIRLLERWMDSFNRPAEKILHGCKIERNFYSNISRELIKFITTFLTDLGVKFDVADSFAENVTVPVEYDSAHRYRLEDLFSTTSKEQMLEYPRREIKKILWHLSDRDERVNLNNKYKAVATILSILLLHPRIKKAFKKALTESKFENFQLDEADRYHVLRLGSYKFMGRDWRDRVLEYKKLHNGNWPEPFPVKVKAT